MKKQSKFLINFLLNDLKIILLRKSLQELIKKRPEQAEDVQKITSQVYKESESILEEEDDEETDEDSNKQSEKSK